MVCCVDDVSVVKLSSFFQHVINLGGKMSNNEKTTHSPRVWTTRILKTSILLKLIHYYTYFLHRVIHRQERLQPLPMEEVGELHVDRSHGACVLHDPVFVHVWGIVVAGGTGKAPGGQEGTDVKKKKKTAQNQDL